MGADDFIRKPFSQRLLLERIRAVLRRADTGTAKGEGAAERHRARRARARSQPPPSAPGRPRRCVSPFTRFLLLKSLTERPGHVKNRDHLHRCRLRRDDLRRRPHDRQPHQRVRASPARLTASSSKSKRFMASDIDTATPEPGRRWLDCRASFRGLRRRSDAAAACRHARLSRRRCCAAAGPRGAIGPLTRRICCSTSFRWPC